MFPRLLKPFSCQLKRGKWEESSQKHFIVVRLHNPLLHTSNLSGPNFKTVIERMFHQNAPSEMFSPHCTLLVFQENLHLLPRTTWCTMNVLKQAWI